MRAPSTASQTSADDNSGTESNSVLSGERRRRRALVAPSPHLSVTVRKTEQSIIVRLKGELDMATILPFRDAAFTAIGDHPPLLVLDLTALTRWDTTGISNLVTIARVARLLKIPYETHPSPSLRALFESTGLNVPLCVPENEPSGK